ncbi:MFS transporter [Cereibacter changlensis JA139]|uniref:MFS transporter n=2 Tax=Cereibacter changlensis TaxID=402884 RepID=A0A2T4JNW5_9RHOB|nr:DHA2 family efflux MFS transporter permease subunit [Cereibacter changlensis]PTE19457.1 MFS transporter [Cereibacter changlensis JA139]PZX47536.1 DHA2 family multidrug resistance protein [Cereibacter changlensis]
MPPAEARPSRPAVWLGFLAMCTGMFMAILDVQIVATSLPNIQQALGIPPDQMSWVQTAYLIAEVIAIPLTGVLMRILTMRWLFVIATTVFTLASLGCAASDSFGTLILWRVLQGFAGGTLIPAVFAAVFLLFPSRRQGIATTLAGVLAVLAPTVGPIVGGWITETWSWHWLFLINLAPGVVAVLLGAALLPRERMQPAAARSLDLVSLTLLVLSLTSLEIALKEAPAASWTSGPVLALLALAVSAGAGFVVRCLKAAPPVVELRSFADRRFAIGCLLSFVLGIGLFGSVYLMPVFLAFVRGHNALEIGTIMLVTGVAQLLTAPIAVAAEQRLGARLLTGFGFALFAAGLGFSALQTPATDHDGMFWPQVLRGVAIMFCLLPPTRLALGHLPEARVPDASGLFNLMRNLGGAIGLALIDTVIYSRSPGHAAALLERLRAQDAEAGRFIGIPAQMIAALPPGPLPPQAEAMLAPLLEKAALTLAINDAWLMIAVLTLAALACVPFAGGPKEAGTGKPSDRQPNGHLEPVPLSGPGRGEGQRSA